MNEDPTSPLDDGDATVSTPVAQVVDTATGKAAPADISTERVKDIFAKIARKYKVFNTLSSFGIYKSWLKSVAKLSEATPQTRVLDVAAGTGDVAYTLCRLTPPRSVEVTDFSPEMLAVARERYDAGENNGVPCSFQLVDAQDMPYEDGSFDLVTCAYGIRNIPDRAKAFSEANRVLKEGGRYVILEFSTPPFVPWRILYHAYLRVMIPFIGGMLTGDRPGFVYLNDSIRAFPDQETLAGYLRAAGFSQVTYVNRSGGIAAIHTAIK